MAKAEKTTPPAKPIHRVTKGDVIVSIFEGNRCVAQRRYRSRDGKTAFASSFRLQDLELLRLAVAEAEEFCEELVAEAKAA